jgi:exopolyphosphatase/guanosine-5'-triphosphate,3'-diphosphate pyrophosphatase
VDVGGGSVELAVGARGRCTDAYSLPLGVLRLREALVPADGRVSETVASAIAERVRGLATEAALMVKRSAPPIVLTSGTARALASLMPRLGTDGPNDPKILTRASLERASARLAELDRGGLIALGVDPARADTVAVGAVVVRVLLELLGAGEARVGDRALREGVAVYESYLEAA